MFGKKFNSVFGKLRTVHTQLQKLNAEKRLCCISDSHCCNNCEYISIHIYMYTLVSMCVCIIYVSYIHAYICNLLVPKSCSGSQLFTASDQTHAFI